MRSKGINIFNETRKKFKNKKEETSIPSVSLLIKSPIQVLTGPNRLDIESPEGVAILHKEVAIYPSQGVDAILHKEEAILHKEEAILHKENGILHKEEAILHNEVEILRSKGINIFNETRKKFQNKKEETSIPSVSLLIKSPIQVLTGTNWLDIESPEGMAILHKEVAILHKEVAILHKELVILHKEEGIPSQGGGNPSQGGGNPSQGVGNISFTRRRQSFKRRTESFRRRRQSFTRS